MAQTEEERRESKRIWAAAKRAEIAAERDARLRADRADAVAHAPRTHRDAYEASVSAAKWFKPSDGALVALGRLLAEDLDYADYLGDDALVLRIIGRLTSILGQLGLTPVVRMRFELRSAQIEARKATESAEAAPPAPAGAPPLPANVSKLARPAKRGDGGDRG
ncbi:terminase small subunit [Microbacterium proteolyticum]|uniref:terminase small subunit n=1 Tax=Microbacterium proteolyticum TaxID=1572644 RepID=UPI003CCD74DD